MNNVENLEDHMAFSCNCGCVRFNLLKSNNIECNDCGEKLKQISWGIAEAEKKCENCGEFGKCCQAEKQEPKCNPHPKAPHGFNRNASHANDRYTCECESWDAYDAGYQAGLLKGFDAEDEAEKQQHGSPEDMYVEMHKHLNCPHCGGSGHIDDVAEKHEPDDLTIAYMCGYSKGVDAGKAAVKVEKQEPVAYVIESKALGAVALKLTKEIPIGTQLYTHAQPTQPEAQKQTCAGGLWIDGVAMSPSDMEAIAKTWLATQPEAEKQEPVAWLHKQGNFTEACMNALHDDEIDRGWTQQPLYTSPPPVAEPHKRQWVGLTDEQKVALCKQFPENLTFNSISAIEAKLKEKNTRNGGCL